MSRAFRYTNQGVFDRVNVRDVALGKISTQDALHGKVFADEPRNFEGEFIDFNFAVVFADVIHASSIAAKESWSGVGTAQGTLLIVKTGSVDEAKWGTSINMYVHRLSFNFKSFDQMSAGSVIDWCSGDRSNVNVDGQGGNGGTDRRRSWRPLRSQRKF